MGGNAFPPTTATRLTSTQHTALLAYCRARLPFTPIAAPRYLTSKVTHGDLDVLCGWDGVGYSPGKGGARGVLTPGEHDLDPDLKMTSPAPEVNAWCHALTARLGGTKWTRSGAQVTIAVPATVIGGSDGFFQVDLMLFPPETTPFVTFTYSYSATVVILSHFARYAADTHAMTVQAHCVLLRIRPFPGHKALDVILTSDPGTFCQWLGLDFGAWQDESFDDLADLFRWFARLRPRSPGELALRRLATYGQYSESNNRKLYVLDTFGTWLRQNGWTLSENSNTTVPPPPLSPPVPSPSTPATMLDLDSPRPLTLPERNQLAYWGKEDAYESQLATLTASLKVEKEAMARKRAAREKKEARQREVAVLNVATDEKEMAEVQ